MRNESKGIMNISKIVQIVHKDRKEQEKQFFIMFLKLRVDFFKSFEKKTLEFMIA